MKFREEHDTPYCLACEATGASKVVETAKHILAECPATEAIVAVSADPVIIQSMDALRAKLRKDGPGQNPPPDPSQEPFWTCKAQNNAVDPDLHWWIQLGAITKSSVKEDRKLGFSPADCRSLALALSKLLVERSQHAYDVHRALNLESLRLRARPPPLPGEPISSGVPDPPQQPSAAAAAAAAPLEDQII